jgi:peptidoglycan/LPS O-acetylase OafA/YrhL
MEPLAAVAEARPSARAVEVGKRIRLGELDGVRGWGAFSVLLFHSTWEIFGQAQPAFHSPFAGLLYGPLDICVFFVISGAALAAPFYAGGGAAYVVSAALRRYLRLTIPIVIGALLVYVASLLGLVASHEASELAPSFLGKDILNPTLTQTLKWACCNVYTKPEVLGPILPFMWTMQWEMIGSLTLFLMLACYPAMKKPDFTMLVCACFLAIPFPYLAAFLFGAQIGRARVLGLGERATAALAVLDRSDVKIAAGLALYAIAAGTLGKRTSHMEIVIALAAVALLVGSRPVRAFLSDHPLSQFLARISFPLYLVHYIVLITFTSWLIVLCGKTPEIWQACAIAAATVVVSVVAAIAFAPVELLAHRVSRRFSTFVLEGK